MEEPLKLEGEKAARLGRIAAQTAKQVIVQKVREAEDELMKLMAAN